MEKLNMFLNATPIIFDFARQLRTSQTEAEKILWSRLCRNQLGVRFRRQHPLLTYVADFYCHKKKLIVELDGSIHDEPQQKFEDGIRTDTLIPYQIRIIRFKNEEVFGEIDRVVEVIKKSLELS